MYFCGWHVVSVGYVTGFKLLRSLVCAFDGTRLDVGDALLVDSWCNFVGCDSAVVRSLSC